MASSRSPDAMDPRGIRALLVRRRAERRAVVLTSAVVLLAVVFVAMRIVDDAASGVAGLAVLPVALIGLELGLAGGLAGAAAAASVVAVNAAGGHPALGLAGVITRTVVFLAVAAVAGRFSDRMRAARARDERRLESGLDLGGGVSEQEVSEIVARAAARTPGVSGARVWLGPDVMATTGDPGDRPVRIPIRARGVDFGRLDLGCAQPLGPEERAGLELLARQAGLAADNQRLLERERERAGIEAELRRVRDEVTLQRSGLGQLLASQEDERTRLATRLHDELAQVLAAVLMGLRHLERTDTERRSASLEDLRDQVVDVLRDLREVAGSLRPVSLTQLGLRPALEALSTAGPARLDLDLDAAPPLPPPVETAVYRMVEEAVSAAGRTHAQGPVQVTLSGTPDGVRLDLRLPREAGDGALLTTLRARAEIVDGTLEPSVVDGSAQMRVALPLAAA